MLPKNYCKRFGVDLFALDEIARTPNRSRHFENARGCCGEMHLRECEFSKQHDIFGNSRRFVFWRDLVEIRKVFKIGGFICVSKSEVDEKCRRWIEKDVAVYAFDGLKLFTFKKYFKFLSAFFFPLDRFLKLFLNSNKPFFSKQNPEYFSLNTAPTGMLESYFSIFSNCSWVCKIQTTSFIFVLHIKAPTGMFEIHSSWFLTVHGFARDRYFSILHLMWWHKTIISNSWQN